MKHSKWIGLLPCYLIVCGLFVGAAHLGSETVTAFVQMQPVEREYRFVIDAGHGGVDGGASSCTGVLESHINLEIALRLRDLMHFLGMDTVMIRQTDISVYTNGNSIAQKKISDLKERVRIVNATEGAVLISIHQNTFSDSRYHGAQVFYGRDPRSRNLAGKLQSAFVSTCNKGSNRKAKKAEGIYLMDQVEVTALLVECGFLSNPEEEAKLRNPEYQKAICCVIASTLSFAADA